MSDPESNHRSPTPPHALRRRGHQTLRRNSDRHSYAGLDRSPRFPDFLHPPRNNELNWNLRGNSLISDIDIRRTEELVPEQSGAANFAPFPRNGVLATKGVEAVWNMDSTQDITVHLDLECDESIEAHVEELSRLRRLGDFEAALQYIESCPDECRNNMDFAVNYADILLMQGDLDYKKLERLGLTFPKIYQQCIDCAIFKMKFVRASGSEFDYDACNLLELEMAKELKPDFPRLDSMQVKLLCNWLRLDEASNIAKRVSTAEWKTLYNHLASQNRVSDMRDLFHTLSESDVMSAIHGWFEMDLVSENSISDFVARWTELRDKFTDIALLDVLASMCLQIFLNYVYPRKEYVRHASQCIEYARQFANSVSSNSPEDTKSESYLTWILAEEKLSRILKRSEPRLINHFRGFPGIVIWQRDLPIYVPFSNENPGWVIDEPLRRSDDLLELGLNTARELGNFSLEGKFLEEIILGSQAPLELLRERARLQKDVQRYRQGYLATCLTRYLVAANETVQRELYDDLSNFDDEEIGFPVDRGDAIMLKWCQNRIQRALCISLRGTKEQLDIHTRKEVFLHKKVSENHPELFESNMRAMAVNEQNDSSLRIGRNHNDISYQRYEKSSVAKDERYWENRPRRMFESINTDTIELPREEMQSESDMNGSEGRIYSSDRDRWAQGKKTARSLGKHIFAPQQANGVHINGIGRTGARGSLYGNTSDEDDIHGEDDPHHTVTQNRYDTDAHQSETSASVYYSDQESLDN
ncbi:uncharacterized protein EAF02_003391 [Botrytis sinoallii]|uniref:uncharacterized protein n=1 Tax=Botrytis sinoallii TaxID=1463999 RepID=UPI001901604E|nr:uncharacterized protein EAF02_003391 [Botrytis sinoallii]KAF7886744.1 hypothetical protein EAF02_003391 [Botrytis sinoallii]